MLSFPFNRYSLMQSHTHPWYNLPHYEGKTKQRPCTANLEMSGQVVPKTSVPTNTQTDRQNKQTQYTLMTIPHSHTRRGAINGGIIIRPWSVVIFFSSLVAAGRLRVGRLQALAGTHQCAYRPYPPRVHCFQLWEAEPRPQDDLTSCPNLRVNWC